MIEGTDFGLINLYEFDRSTFLPAIIIQKEKIKIKCVH